MARAVKDHDSRRSEILDVAQHLFYQKGYDQTSIQDLLNAVGIAKGTFYHYFDSKQALLEELVDRIVDDALVLVAQVVDNPSLDGLEKFRQIFFQSHSWKVEHKEFVLSIMETYYHDDNLRMRYHLINSATAKTIPLLTKVVEQGIAEGHFSTPCPEETARIAYSLIQAMAEAMGNLILSAQSTTDMAEIRVQLDRKIVAYQQAVERVLGAPAGSLAIFDGDIIFQKWIASE